MYSTSIVESQKMVPSKILQKNVLKFKDGILLKEAWWSDNGIKEICFLTHWFIGDKQGKIFQTK